MNGNIADALAEFGLRVNVSLVILTVALAIATLVFVAGTIVGP